MYRRAPKHQKFSAEALFQEGWKGVMKRILHAVTSYLRQTDKWLWAMCLSLSACSVLLLCGIHFSGNAINAADVGLRQIAVQAGAAAIGAGAAVVISRFDYHTLGRLWKLHVPLMYGLVLLTFLIGEGTPARPEDKSWLRLGPLTLQPTELLKISFILTLAYHIYKLHDQVNRPVNLLAICAHGAIPILLVHFQGDDGTALVIALVFVGMLFAAGISWKYIVAAAVALVATAPLVWTHIVNPDQKQRILALFDPNADLLGGLYQQYNAKLAIGSGQIWGKGLFGVSHQYVPEVHNDFILAFIGESFGYVGCLAVIALFGALCCKTLANARRAEDSLGRLICVGVFSLITAQIFVNVGMCLMVLPVIGITLPFLSAGGSSVLAIYLGLGLVLSVYMHTSQNLFSR